MGNDTETKGRFTGKWQFIFSLISNRFSFSSEYKEVESLSVLLVLGWAKGFCSGVMAGLERLFLLRKCFISVCVHFIYSLHSGRQGTHHIPCLFLKFIGCYSKTVWRLDEFFQWNIKLILSTEVSNDRDVLLELLEKITHIVRNSFITELQTNNLILKSKY